MQEDIRENEEQVSKNAKKPPKEPKAPKPKPEKTIKTPKSKPEKKPTASKSSKSSGGIIACVFLIMLVLAGAALVYFNVGGIGESVVAVISTNLPQNETVDEGPTAEELLKTENDLKKFEETLEKRKQRLDKKEDELIAQEKDLSDREQTLAEQMTAFKDESAEVYALAEEQASIKAAAQIFEQMDAAKAAEALSKQKNITYIADLLKAMSEQKAALILDNMDATLTNKVLTEMLNEQQR